MKNVSLDSVQDQTAQIPSFEQKLYATLRNIDSKVIGEYLESFGLEGDRAPLGLKFKEAADQMTEADFVAAMRTGKLPVTEFSPIEIEVLFRGATDGIQGIGADPCGPAILQKSETNN